MKNRTIKEICLLLFGSSLSLLFLPFEEKIISGSTNALAVVVFFSSALFFVGIGLLDWLAKITDQLILARNKKRNLVVLYSPYEINDKNSSWVDLSVKQIIELIKSTKKPVKKIIKSIHFNRYPIVINPYGGCYPENNLSNLKTLKKIFSYVKNGGVYVNIADIPFYYAYNERLGRKVDTTPLTPEIPVKRSFLQSMLTAKLHLFVLGLVKGKIKRVIELTNNSINFSRPIPLTEGKFSSFLAIPYGEGFFVFSTVEINKDTKQRILKIVKESISLIHL